MTTHNQTKAARSSLRAMAKAVATTATVSALAFSSASTLAIEPLTTSGNKVLVGGQVKPLGGYSLFWHNVPAAAEYYNQQAVANLANNHGGKIVRAAIGVEVGFNSDRTLLGDWAGSMAMVDEVVKGAVANDMYVIIDFHTHDAERLTATAKKFFAEVSSKYGHLDNVIYEIYNEPDNKNNDVVGEMTPWWKVKQYAEEVIPVIRQNDPDNLIIVGTPQWSQRVDEASRDQINDVNVAYTLHFYAATHKEQLRAWGQEALNNGAPLFVTEWGTGTADGKGFVDVGSTNTWINWLNERGIAHANWSASHQPETTAMFHGGGGLTESGNLVDSLVKATNGSGGDDVITGDCSLETLPVTLQAERFCHAKGIQTEQTTDVGGGENLGFIDQGDWFTYDIDVPQGGGVTVNYRVASEVGGGVIQIEEAGGGEVYGTINVPNTGGWQAWQTISHSISLPQGLNTIAISAPEGGWNLNWIQLEADEVCVGAECCEPNCHTGGGRVEAEGFTNMSGIQLEATSDVGGGQNVGWTDAGDWMSYGVDLPESASGNYTITYRVASDLGGGVIQLEDGQTGAVYGSVNVGNTGGWQVWTNVSHVVSLPQDTSSLRLRANHGAWNLNWFDIAAAGDVCTSNCGGDPIIIQAENFSEMSGVQTENTSDAGGGANVGWLDAGDWMVYAAVDIPASGAYKVEYRVASQNGGGQLQLEAQGGTQVYGQLSVPNTGGWQTWTTVEHTVQLDAGSQNIAIAVLNGGWNLNWVKITPVNE